MMYPTVLRIIEKVTHSKGNFTKGECYYCARYAIFNFAILIHINFAM